LDASLLEAVGSDYFPTIARRPKDTSYDLKKLDSTGLKLSNIEAGLKQMKAEASNNLLETIVAQFCLPFAQGHP